MLNYTVVYNLGGIFTVESKAVLGLRRAVAANTGSEAS